MTSIPFTRLFQLKELFQLRFMKKKEKKKKVNVDTNIMF
jgi:hypothetical protein